MNYKKENINQAYIKKLEDKVTKKHFGAQK